MIQIIADNIISGLGGTVSQNLEAIRQGRTALKPSSLFRVPDGGRVVVSQMDDGFIAAPLRNRDFTRLEKFMISSALESCKSLGADILKDKSTIFVFSTTKGNIKYLGKDIQRSALWRSAEAVSSFFGNPNRPLTVSNACISGIAAIIVAKRLLQARLYKTAVVIGADELTEFVVSGFGSFKALSDEPCRPFDAARRGLNIGEAVGTVILRRADSADDIFYRDDYLKTPQFITSGAITNDATHIPGPSRTAEGLYRAIARTLDFEYGLTAEVSSGEAFINPHGTATLYNDQMESLAISRSGLSDLDVFPLKGYFGHTLGASGVIETIISCHFLDEGWLPAAMGYTSEGCSPAPKIISKPRKTDARWFLKTVSGFGGSNAAIKVEKLHDGLSAKSDTSYQSVSIQQMEGKVFSFDCIGDVKESLNALYRQREMNYPKFHKMDVLCKAGTIAADQLLDSFCQDSRTALVMMNASSSIAADTEYLTTIAEDNFFPSPSVFVYTLPSIVIGELSIRYKLYGEGAFFVCRDFDRAMALDYIRCLFAEGAADRALLCWIEANSQSCNVRAEVLQFFTKLRV